MTYKTKILSAGPGYAKVEFENAQGLIYERIVNFSKTFEINPDKPEDVLTYPDIANIIEQIAAGTKHKEMVGAIEFRSRAIDLPSAPEVSNDNLEEPPAA